MQPDRIAGIGSIFLALLAMSICMSACGGNGSPSTPTPPPTPTPTTSDGKADALIAKMTQDEKLQMVRGGVTSSDTWYVPRGAGGWIPGISRLNIPALYLADGSLGACVAGGATTALPSSIASAASWDLNEAAKFGSVIGQSFGAAFAMVAGTNSDGSSWKDCP